MARGAIRWAIVRGVTPHFRHRPDQARATSPGCAHDVASARRSKGKLQSRLQSMLARVDIRGETAKAKRRCIDFVDVQQLRERGGDSLRAPARRAQDERPGPGGSPNDPTAATVQFQGRTPRNGLRTSHKPSQSRSAEYGCALHGFTTHPGSYDMRCTWQGNCSLYRQRRNRQRRFQQHNEFRVARGVPPAAIQKERKRCRFETSSPRFLPARS